LKNFSSILLPFTHAQIKVLHEGERFTGEDPPLHVFAPLPPLLDILLDYYLFLLDYVPLVVQEDHQFVLLSQDLSPALLYLLHCLILPLV
jgi:hypothetical protein